MYGRMCGTKYVCFNIPIVREIVYKLNGYFIKKTSNVMNISIIIMILIISLKKKSWKK